MKAIKSLLALASLAAAGAAFADSAVVNLNSASQTQSGTRNQQSMILGKIDKDFGSHSSTVTANNVFQTQSGTRNEQRMKVGVIE